MVRIACNYNLLSWFVVCGCFRFSQSGSVRNENDVVLHTYSIRQSYRRYTEGPIAHITDRARSPGVIYSPGIHPLIKRSECLLGSALPSTYVIYCLCPMHAKVTDLRRSHLTRSCVRRMRAILDHFKFIYSYSIIYKPIYIIHTYIR